MLVVEIQKRLHHFELDVHFSVGNEIVVLFGPSGSGKTTILNNVSGLSHPEQGTIQLGDVTYFSKGKKPIPVQRRKIGYLFQDYALFPHMTVEKNILYGVNKQQSKGHTEVISSLIEELGIEHLLSKYPKQISGGEKQRVALTRALATEPRLLLLDEPFSALDSKTRIQCHEQLLTLHKKWNIPILLVTHNLEEAQKLGDRILFMEKGKFVNETSKSNITPIKSEKQAVETF
ncbi:ATP-binding cassette domain-containing protein [Cytobacillus praedii]|uniref:ATP-binding cassette domain-containing protein n=1 Tax=Cytobacillus praedii TaxID=1742358 RepID=UPI003F7FB9D2